MVISAFLLLIMVYPFRFSTAADLGRFVTSLYPFVHSFRHSSVRCAYKSILRRNSVAPDGFSTGFQQKLPQSYGQLPQEGTQETSNSLMSQSLSQPNG